MSPNWVANNLSIIGDEQKVTEVKNKLNQPFQKGQTVYSKPIFAFWNIVRPPEDKMDEYFGTNGFSNGEKVGDTEFNWYNFNRKRWGTKWDVAVSDDFELSGLDSETRLLEESNTYLRYRFYTAWGPPIEVLSELSTQHPMVRLVLDYEEESGWGGENIWQDGKMWKDHYYDS